MISTVKKGWIAGVLCAVFALSLSPRTTFSADVPYVPSGDTVVDAMLKLGGVNAKDYLIDLGSGDGRIVIAAAKLYGARGFGVEIDDSLVRTSRRNAEKAGVSDRAEFFTRNLFDTDLSKATVITLYLYHSVLLRLRPSLLKLKPGTRLVSHDFDMLKWTPDAKVTVDVPGKPYGPPVSDIYFWIVPADVSGQWRWQLPAGAGNAEYQANFEQTFQMLAGAVQTGGRSTAVRDVRVRGEAVEFAVQMDRDGRSVLHEFSGRVDGDVMTGRVVIDGVQTPWRATRTSRGRMITDI